MTVSIYLCLKFHCFSMDSLINDKLILEDNFMLLFQDDPVIMALNSQIENFTIDSNTHELQLKINRMKQKKTHIKIKHFKKEIVAKSKTI